MVIREKKKQKKKAQISQEAYARQGRFPKVCHISITPTSSKN